jgi:hypothetical protein
MPARHGLWIPVQQQYWFTLAGINHLDGRAAGTDQSLGKARK